MPATPAISYVRFSTSDQARGASLARQTDLARQYCESHGLILSEKLHDLGISAFKGRNASQGALGRLLELVEQGKIKRGTHLLVESIDRISRQEPLEALPVLLDLIRRGVVIVTLGDGALYDREALNSGKAFMLLAIVQRAHEESATKSKRLRDAWDRKRQQVADGRPLTGRCPAWLKISKDRSRYLLDRKAAAAIRRIFEMSAAGSGIRSIERTLNQERVPPIGRADSWYQSYVRKILFNRSVLGEFQPHAMRDGQRVPHGQPIEDYFPAVIDKALWHRAHRAMEARHKRPPGRTGQWVGLLSGLLVDSLGSTWVHLNKHRHQLISDKGRRGVKGHEYASVPAEPFEQLVLLLLQVTWKPQQVEGAEDKVAAAEADLADVAARLEAVREGIASGDPSTVKTLVSLVSDLERRETELEAEVERLKAQSVGGGADLLPSLAEQFLADPTDRQTRLQLRQIMREHVDQVVIEDREQLACEPMKDPQTGRWIKRHAGQWVDVVVRLRGGLEQRGRLFLPLRDGLPALRLPFDEDDDVDLAAWTALAATRRVAHSMDGEGSLFTLHPEPLPEAPIMPIVTVLEIDGLPWVNVDGPPGTSAQVDEALAADGLRRGRTRKRIGAGMHAERVLGRRGEAVKVERVREVFRAGEFPMQSTHHLTSVGLKTTC